MEQRYDGSYFRFALAYSLRHRGTLQDDPLPAEVEAHYVDMAEASLEKRWLIEARDLVPFETYRQQYLAPESVRTG